jgi:hypothetical protein
MHERPAERGGALSPMKYSLIPSTGLERRALIEPTPIFAMYAR